MARVLIVDDSSFMRNSLRVMLEALGHEVVGAASEGAEGVALATKHRPDLILMDLVMRGLDGFQATRKIMATAPTKIVILSSLTAPGRRETIAALNAGAVDFLQKPDAAGLPALKKELAAKIAGVLHVKRPERSSASARARPILDQLPVPPKGGFGLVAVGVSTGGPSALERVLTPIPSHFPLPILIAQHMPAKWTQSLAEHLDEVCAIKVEEARSLERVEPGVAYIAPGDYHLELSSTGTCRITQRPKELGFRPSVNVLFRSVAEVMKERTLAVVLTGMGNDGLEGAREIDKAGGKIIVQDEASCVVYGMPQVIVAAGLAAWQATSGRIGDYLASLAPKPVNK